MNLRHLLPLMGLLPLLCIPSAAFPGAWSGYTHDSDFDGIEDFFDSCPNTYAPTKDGCQGSLPDDRKFTCDMPLWLRPGASVRGGAVRLPLSRAFCQDDVNALQVRIKDGVVEVWAPRQRVGLKDGIPHEEQPAYWQENYSNPNVTVTGSWFSDKTRHTRHVMVEFAGEQAPWVMWPKGKRHLRIYPANPNSPYAHKITSKMTRVVSDEYLVELNTADQHDFDVMSVSYVTEEYVDAVSNDVKRDGIRFETTIGHAPEFLSYAVKEQVLSEESWEWEDRTMTAEQLPPLGARTGDKKADFALLYNTSRENRGVQYTDDLENPHPADARRLEESRRNIRFMPGEFRVSFPRALCTFEHDDYVDPEGASRLFASHVAVKEHDANPMDLSRKSVDECRLKFLVCTPDINAFSNPQIETSDDGSITLWFEHTRVAPSHTCFQQRPSVRRNRL